MSKTCLIIDDVDVSRYVARQHMAQLGFSALEAIEPKAAWEELSRAHVDVILLDWHLRRENGLEFIEKVRSHTNTRNVPVIVVSGVEQGNKLEEIKSAGAQGYIAKPVTLESLTAELQRLKLL